MRSSELNAGQIHLITHCCFPSTVPIRFLQIRYTRSGIIMNRTRDALIFKAKIYCSNSIVQRKRRIYKGKIKHGQPEKFSKDKTKRRAPNKRTQREGG